LHRLLANDTRVRVLGRGAREAERRGTPARAHQSQDRPPIALSCLARFARRRLAGARRTAAPARAHRARDATALRLPAFLARRRPRHLGQPRYDASRPSLRRFRAPPRAAARDHPRPAGLASPEGELRQIVGYILSLNCPLARWAGRSTRPPPPGSRHGERALVMPEPRPRPALPSHRDPRRSRNAPTAR